MGSFTKNNFNVQLIGQITKMIWKEVVMTDMITKMVVQTQATVIHKYCHEIKAKVTRSQNAWEFATELVCFCLLELKDVKITTVDHYDNKL